MPLQLVLLCTCVRVCIFIKVRITAHSSPAILVILCHSHWSSQGGINDNVCMCVCLLSLSMCICLCVCVFVCACVYLSVRVCIYYVCMCLCALLQFGKIRKNFYIQKRSQNISIAFVAANGCDRFRVSSFTSVAVAFKMKKGAQLCCTTKPIVRDLVKPFMVRIWGFQVFFVRFRL